MKLLLMAVLIACACCSQMNPLDAGFNGIFEYEVKGAERHQVAYGEEAVVLDYPFS